MVSILQINLLYFSFMKLFQIYYKGFPANKLDKKFEKFLNGLISKSSRADLEELLEFCFGNLYIEKSTSNYGFRIFMQLISRQHPTLLFNNLNKVKKNLLE
jgi:hypothetical protein